MYKLIYHFLCDAIKTSPLTSPEMFDEISQKLYYHAELFLVDEDKHILNFIVDAIINLVMDIYTKCNIHLILAPYGVVYACNPHIFKGSRCVKIAIQFY